MDCSYFPDHFNVCSPEQLTHFLTPPFRTWPQKGSNSKCVTASADRLWYGLSHHVNPGKPEAQRPEVILWLLPTKAQRPETGSHSMTPSYPTLPSLWSYITTCFSDPFYSRVKGQGRQTEHPKEALSTTDERTWKDNVEWSLSYHHNFEFKDIMFLHTLDRKAVQIYSTYFWLGHFIICFLQIGNIFHLYNITIEVNFRWIKYIEIAFSLLYFGKSCAHTWEHLPFHSTRLYLCWQGCWTVQWCTVTTFLSSGMQSVVF